MAGFSFIILHFYFLLLHLFFVYIFFLPSVEFCLQLLLYYFTYKNLTTIYFYFFHSLCYSCHAFYFYVYYKPQNTLLLIFLEIVNSPLKIVFERKGKVFFYITHILIIYGATIPLCRFHLSLFLFSLNNFL